MKIVVVRDIKGDVYTIPMFVAHLGGAIRSFQDEIAKTDGNPFALHPEDYELFHIGEYDELTCKFDLHDPIQLAVGSNFKVTR